MLKSATGGGVEVDVDSKSKEAGVLERSLLEDKEQPVRKEGKKASAAPRAEETAPKPRQRTKLQKPPLLPKPRSVPKREITLPPAAGAPTCGPSGRVDEDGPSVSGGWTVKKIPE